MEPSEALDTIDAALKAVVHWNPDEPDEKTIDAALKAVGHWDPDKEERATMYDAMLAEKRAAMYAVMDAGYRAAYDLTVPEGTTSPGAEPRRERLAAQRIWAVFGGLAARNEPLDEEWVAVARAAALLGCLVISFMREDYSASKKRHKAARVSGKLSGGDDLGQIQEEWVKYAKKRAVEAPGIGPSKLAAEIAGSEGLNPKREATNRHPYGKRRAIGTIRNYLSRNRAKWNPDRP